MSAFHFPDPELNRPRDHFAAPVLELDVVLDLFAEFAESSLGRRALQDLEPRTDTEAAAALTRLIEMQRLIAAEDAPSFAGVTDPALPGATERGLLEEQFMGVRGFCSASGRMAEWFESRASDAPELAAVAAALPDLSSVVRAVDRVLDERGRVRSDASDLLARLLRTERNCSDQIDRILGELLRRSDVRNFLSDGSVHRRAGRPVLAVKAKSSGRVRGILHDRSQSDQSVFIEPEAVVELGNRLAVARADSRREIDRVLLELSHSVADRAPVIRAATDLVAELELAWIGAGYAKAHGARAALLPGSKGAAHGLLLRAARHPLLIEQVRVGNLSEVVPIDLRLGSEFDMLIITGPNTGGKTLALKTAGLFAVMTRMGLPVPAAEGTTIPLYDRIEADIGDEQEIRQNLSTFASHLVRIRGGLERASERSLVLLDELGGGTDPDEGAALGEAVLEFLLKHRVPTLVSTHIGKLKELAFRRARAENACTEFDLETLAPCYKLILGTPGESGALAIARRFGLPAEVVNAAAQRTERREGELAELMEDVRRARVQAEQARSQAEEQWEDSQRTKRDLEEREAKLELRSERLEGEAQQGLEERVRDAVRELAQARALLDQLPKEHAAEMAERLERLEQHLTGASLTGRRQAFLDGLSKGQLVYLPRYRKRVVIQKMDRTKRIMTVRVGKLNMRVSFDEITSFDQH
ncbi:MAG: DNA mismatch repair protein MutS2 [Chlamydiales bacterium]|jgi:DNA mismatch repair protein MutS2